jgi:hypothetical protein
MRFESIDYMKSLTNFCFTRHKFPTHFITSYTSSILHQTSHVPLVQNLASCASPSPSYVPSTTHLQVLNNIITMPQSPTPARTFPALTHSRNSAASTTLTTPASSPTYTFHWICPRKFCHTCPTRSVPFAPAPPRQFEDYEDQQQLDLEYEHEEIGEFIFMLCMLGIHTDRRRGFGL